MVRYLNRENSCKYCKCVLVTFKRDVSAEEAHLGRGENSKNFSHIHMHTKKTIQSIKKKKTPIRGRD